MTKVTILGQEPKESKKKPIEFVKEISGCDDWVNADNEPCEWENVELMCKNFTDLHGSELDLFFAFDQVRSNGVLYLGHFNDGVVE